MTNTVLNPDELIQHIPALQNRKSGTSAKNKLGRLNINLKKLKEKERRITELYEDSAFNYQEFTKQVSALDIEKFENQKIRLLTTTLLAEESQTVVDAIQRYCTDLAKQYDGGRQFYLKYIQRVTHQKLDRYDRVIVAGSCPANIHGEVVKVEWQVERRVDRTEIVKQLKENPRNNEQIKKKEYGELLLANTEEL